MDNPEICYRGLSLKKGLIDNIFWYIYIPIYYTIYTLLYLSMYALNSRFEFILVVQVVLILWSDRKHWFIETFDG